MNLIEEYNKRQDHFHYIHTRDKDMGLYESDSLFSRRMNMLKRFIHDSVTDVERWRKLKADFTSLTFCYEAQPVRDFRSYAERDALWVRNNYLLARQLVVRSVVMFMLGDVSESERLLKETGGYL